MKIQIHEDVQELLEEMNVIGPSIIFGGYLRDMIFGNTPNDVDIVTNIPINILDEMYGHLEKAKARVTTSGQNIFSFKMHRTEKIFVEIVSTNGNIFEKSKQADYTINSLLYDGKQLIDNQGALNDIENRVVREVDANIITHDLEARPYLWLKTLRLVSMTGFDLSDATFDVLDKNKDCINRISTEIMQTEGHKTMNGLNPFKAMELLTKMGFLSPFEVKYFKEQKIAIQPQQHLCLLALLSNKTVVDKFTEFYCFQEDLINKYEKLYSMHNSEERPPSRFRHQLITIDKIIRGMKNGDL